MMTLLTILIMAFFGGSLFLALWFGYRATEAEREAKEGESLRPRALEGPHFFTVLSPDTVADPATISPTALISGIEDRIRREGPVAAEFANEPAVDRLYPEALHRVDDLTRDLELRIQHEMKATDEFFTEPTVDKLFEGLGFATA